MIEFDGSMSVPSYATAATVALTGWKFRYLHDDNHVGSIGVKIVEVSHQGSALRWKAQGWLSDKDFDNGYEFCYHYVAFAWNQAVTDVTPFDNTTHANCLGYNQVGLGCPEAHAETALVVLPSYLRNPDFATKRTVAILPRGFRLSWAPTGTDFRSLCFDFICPQDHELLQISYAQGHAERTIHVGRPYGQLPVPEVPASPDASATVRDEFVSWNSVAILKDDSLRRNMFVVEFFAVLAGDDLDVIQSPFTILPAEDISGGCISGGVPRIKTEDVNVLKVPFDYTIPILTGWELGRGCWDKHVRELGFWLHDVTYAKSSGRLHYGASSVFRDNSDDGHYSRHQIHILGLKASRAPAPDRVLPVR